MTNPTVRALVQHAAPALAARWAADLREVVRSGYEARDEAEVRSSCERGVAAFVAWLASGEPAAIEAYVRDEAASRLAQRVALADLLRALLQFRSTVGSWLGDEMLPSASAWEVAQAVEAFVRDAVGAAGAAYEEETLRGGQDLQAEPKAPPAYPHGVPVAPPAPERAGLPPAGPAAPHPEFPLRQPPPIPPTPEAGRLPARVAEALALAAAFTGAPQAVVVWTGSRSLAAWLDRDAVEVVDAPDAASWFELWTGDGQGWDPALSRGLPGDGWFVVPLPLSRGLLAVRSVAAWTVAVVEHLAPFFASALADADARDAGEEAMGQVIEVMAQAVDAKAGFARGHSTRVAELAGQIAAGLHLATDQVRSIRRAALLHDVGKIAVSERILHKKDRLTAGERTILSLHTERGARLLARAPALAPLAPLVAYHNARYDGGPGRRPARDAIPMGARVIAVADAYDAMISPRPHRRAMPPDDAIAELRRAAGTQFDPAVVEALVEALVRAGIRETSPA